MEQFMCVLTLHTDMVESESPETRYDLQNALCSLLREAYENDVDVADHGYPVRHENLRIPDWEVEVTQITKTETNDA